MHPNIETYKTSVDELFSYLIQPLKDNTSTLSSTVEEKVELIPKEWIIELEQAFSRHGLKFTYSVKESETVWHNDSNMPYATTSAPMYLLKVER
ncbi:hypothetical protein [Acinetobacter pittii]|jgi:hypothetical protein|uniref:hypothetical protein n=1 Tax=Acinetobacter pittii TaxID=48296 RepID=UPI003896BF5B